MKRFNIVAYGSLEDHDSLKEDISDKRFKKVIVRGYKRIFNLTDESSYDFISFIKSKIFGKKKRDVLNVVKDKKSFFNGVMFSVNEDELIKLKKRELEYELFEVYPYDFKTGKKLSKALLFVDKYVGIDNSGKMPDKEYFKLCRGAAYKLGKDFGKMWDDTTFLSSGKNIRLLFS